MEVLKMIYYGLLVATLVALFYNMKRLDKLYHWFIPLIIIAISVQVFGDLLNIIYPHSFNFLFHIYIPAEYSLLALYYHSLLHNPLIKKTIIISAVAVLLFSITYFSLYPDRFFTPDYTDFCITSFLICIWIIVFFVELMQSDEELQLLTYPAFLVNSANLLYYGGCLLAMGFELYLLKHSPKLAIQVRQITHYLNLLLYFVYVIAFLCPIRSKK